MASTVISFSFNDGGGHGVIVLDRFLPTSQARIRKLLRMIDEDWERRSDLRTEIALHCKQRIPALLREREDAVKRAIEAREKAAGMQPEIDQLSQGVLRMQKLVEDFPKGNPKDGRQKLRAQIRRQLRERKILLRKKKAVQREAASSFRYYRTKAVKADRQVLRLKENAKEACHDE